MSLKNIELLRNTAAVAESLIEAGYGLHTIYLDDYRVEIHVDVPDGMPEPTEQVASKIPECSHYEHRFGYICEVGITWLVEAPKLISGEPT